MSVPAARGETLPEARIPPKIPAPKPETMPIPKEESVPVPVGPSDLKAVADLARKANERLLAFQIETAIRPVSVQSGLIKCVLTPDADRGLCAKLSQFLSKQTGINWVVQTQVSGGGQTLQEEKEARQSALLENLKQTPVVSSALAAFPGAKIEKIKPKKAEAATEDTPESNTDVEE